MVKVYAVTLTIGFIGMMVFIFGGTLAENLGRPERDPAERFGLPGKLTVGALIGFGMGGMSAEYSPLDLSWAVSLAIAVGAAVLATLWVRFAAPSESSG